MLFDSLVDFLCQLVLVFKALGSVLAVVLICVIIGKSSIKIVACLAVSLFKNEKILLNNSLFLVELFLLVLGDLLVIVELFDLLVDVLYIVIAVKIA